MHPAETDQGWRSLLLCADLYCQQSDCDQWQFSVLQGELERTGLDIANLQWLTASGFLQHRREVTRRGAPTRDFQQECELAIGASSAFVLTSAGRDWLRSWEPRPSAAGAAPLPLATQREERTPGSRVEGPADDSQRPAPEWNKQHRELWLGGQLVKRYRVPAASQECILDSFQEESRPDVIFDHLDPTPSDPARRLQGVIRGLNRAQLAPLIEFFGTGRGDVIAWRVRAAACGRSGR